MIRSEVICSTVGTAFLRPAAFVLIFFLPLKSFNFPRAIDKLSQTLTLRTGVQNLIDATSGIQRDYMANSAFPSRLLLQIFRVYQALFLKINAASTTHKFV